MHNKVIVIQCDKHWNGRDDILVCENTKEGTNPYIARQGEYLFLSTNEIILQKIFVSWAKKQESISYYLSSL